jgi:glycosidase
MIQRTRRILILTTVLLLVLVAGSVAAGPTANPTSVTLVGNLQSELGCAGDWDPTCAATHLTYDADDDVWQGTFNLPEGSYEYKVALNDAWSEAYPPGFVNLTVTVPAPGGDVKFYYDHKSHFVSNSRNLIIVAVGNWQSEVGCPGDWQPECLRGWMTDTDNDGTYVFETEAIPPGSYEGKGATGENWSNPNYPGGNIPFSVPADGARVVFSFVDATDAMSIQVFPLGHGLDNNIEYYGLGHDSHDTLYRVPFGAVIPNKEVILRFRTYHNDVSSVRVRVWDDVAQSQFFLDMTPAATGISCYDDAQPAETCDFWEARYTPAQPTTLYYRFIVKDGTATAYYEDDEQRDGGWGLAATNTFDRGWVITVYDRSFKPIKWLQNGVVYQIFPDRFRNGRSNNDPNTNEPRYGFPNAVLDQIITKAWNELPEGYCRAYANPATPCTEDPRGRDYFGGDVMGVQQRLNYLKSLGVTAIYFNPVFEAASNHAYDTQDYYQIDHFFGSNAEFEQFLKLAEKSGIKVILDGVFNHVSSDSAYFDRYGHFTTVGACESVDSPYRDWFYFREQAGGPCAGPNGPNTMTYDAWFGFDSLPVLNKSNQKVQRLFYAGSNAVGRYWLRMGADGWRLDVMGDTSFPADFWPEFRSAVKATNPTAPIIGELWKKFEVLPKVRGDQADTAMNYRFRNAILGFFGTIDNKGFVDDGQSDQPPSLFALKLMSVREDNPDASYYTMLNLMDSHDTKRILWSLTPGQNNREDKEFNAANLAAGKQLLRLATVVQMTIPGAPTIYYGDEVGVTGDDDPDDRRTYPWGGEDTALLAHYQKLTSIRKANPAFTQGQMTFLLTDDANRTMAYLLRTNDRAALVAINRNATPQTLVIDAKGMLPDAVRLYDALGTVPGTITGANGVITVQLPGLSAAIFQPRSGQDLQKPAAPKNLIAIAGSGQVALDWPNLPKDGRFIVYRSPLSGGGYLPIATVSRSDYIDTTVTNGETYYYVISALDPSGNEGPQSNEVVATPAYAINWANLQWPPALNHTISTVNRTDTVYGQVYIDGVTSQPGATPGLSAQAGYGPDGTNPATNPNWIWVDAEFQGEAGNNDEFKASFLPETTGNFDYVYRYSTNGGAAWLYADLNGPVPSGSLPSNPGALTVSDSGDTTPPATPTNLIATGFTPNNIDLEWDAVTGDASLYGYEVLRGTAAGGPYEVVGLTTAAEYSDTSVSSGVTYFYVVRAVDLSFNRSGNSNEVEATAGLRTVTITFNVTTPPSTPGDATVYIAGSLHLLEGGLPEWNPGGVALTQVGPNTWQVVLQGKEDTQIAYKYTLGSWDTVEKGGSCNELDNRSLTVVYGPGGTQTVNDTVANWRNVTPCGN